MNGKTKVRQSNIELLRIVAILMVIALHYFNASMGGELGHVASGSINYYLSHFLESLCIVAVNIFVLITGYFSYKKTKIKVSKVADLVLIMIFWGIVLSFAMVLWLSPKSLNLSVMKQIVLIATNQWFVVIYCILYLLIPFINKLIDALQKSSLEALLLINFIFFYVWPTFYTGVTDNSGGYSIINFINLYLIGAYIHKYHDKKIKIGKWLTLYLVLTLITTVFSMVAARAYNYNSIFTLFNCVIVFEIFKSLTIRHSKIINQLATYTFSVYLIDVNTYFNRFLYRDLFHSSKYWNNNLMVVNLVVSVVGIYIVCIILDWLREFVFGKVFNYVSGKVKLEVGK